MTEPAEAGDDPVAPPSPPPDDFAALDAREALFTAALEHAAQIANTAEAMRLQVMLAGFDAMLIEEQEATGQPVRPDDPVVRSFVLHQANVLHVSWQAAQRCIDLGRVLRDRLPVTWTVLLGGRATERAAFVAAELAFGLDGDALAEFDAAAAAMVQTERPGTIERALEKLRDELDPEATITRHREASDRRWVSARPRGNGQGVLELLGPAADVAAIYDAIRQGAVKAHGREGECRTLGQLMFDIGADLILHGAATDAADMTDPAYPMERLGSLAVPHRKAVQASIIVVVPAATATGAGNGPGEIAGMGSIDADVARQIVQHTTTWTRAAVDPIADTVFGIDTHERYIPAGLKKLLHLRSRTCTGDDCGLPAHRGDIDHITRYEHDGRTRHDNLQILCRRVHQAKDAGHIDVRMMPDGRIRWGNKWGGVRYVKPAVTITTRTYPDEPPF